MNMTLAPLFSGLRGHILTLLAGMLLPLAFSPFHYYPVAVISLTILFLSWWADDLKYAPLRGFLFGLGMYGVGVSWVYVAIHDFGNASLPVATLLTAGFVTFLSLYLAGLGWLLRKLAAGRSQALDLVFLFPVAWLAFEAFKGWFLTGFPWLEVGAGQIDGPLKGYIPIMGTLGASLITALSSGLIAYSLLTRKLLALSLVVIIWIGGYLLADHDWTEVRDEPLKVTLIQGNVSQEIKWDTAQLYKTLALYRKLTEQNWDSDLIVWPENAAPVFYHQAKEFYFNPLAEQARLHNSDVLLGVPVMDLATKKYFNSMVSLGDNFGVYSKSHLVPFGDYVPFEWLRGLIAFFDLPMSSFTPGAKKQPLLEVAGQKIGVSICYEDVFSSEIMYTVAESGFLVNATNNAWYGDSFAPHQHLQISQNRALEFGRPIVRATTNGISAFIDQFGYLISESAQFEQAVMTEDVQPRQGLTPYVRMGVLPLWLSSLFMLLAWAYYRRMISKDKIRK